MGKRVLVADDSATIQRAFAMVFGSREDVSLVPARSLDDAVAAARQGRPDLVIADANLGGRTGYELCSAIKSDAGLRGVPVYILASSHSPYDDGKGRSAGVDGHLTKPFESQALIDKVLEILARPTSIAATVTAPRGRTAGTDAADGPAGGQPVAVASVLGVRGAAHRRSAAHRRPCGRSQQRPSRRRRRRLRRVQDRALFGRAPDAARGSPGRQRAAGGFGAPAVGSRRGADQLRLRSGRPRPAVWSPARHRPASPPRHRRRPRACARR